MSLREGGDVSESSSLFIRKQTAATDVEQGTSRVLLALSLGYFVVISR